MFELQYPRRRRVARMAGFCLCATLAFFTDITALAEDSSVFSEHVENGLKAYKTKRYMAAVDAFRLAYKINPEPTLLFNIARSLERLGEIDDAILHYQTYVDAPGTTAQDRAQALEQIGALRKEKRARKNVEKSSMPALPPLHEKKPTSPVEADPKPDPAKSLGDASLGADALVVVVHKHNALAKMAPERLRDVYLGHHRQWADGRPIQMYARPSGSRVSKSFFRQLPRLTLTQYTRHWRRKQLTGESMPPRVVASAGKLLRLVARDEGAIGYLRMSEVSKLPEQVRVLVTLD